MKNPRSRSSFALWLLVLLPVFFLVLHTQLLADDTKPNTDEETSTRPAETAEEILRKELPQSLDDLQLIEDQIQKHRKRMLESTVGVLVPETRSQGSGVIVNEEGYVLTAAHVITRRGIAAIISFPDGRKVRAETLGADHDSDAGMLRIVEKGTWTFSPMAKADSTKLGDWCIATGHPGGQQPGRPPVIRIGRVNNIDEMIRTDATLVGGDSGGPLFNLKGEVIGINSRIGVSTSWNLHVPVADYENDWKNLSSPAGFLGVGGNLNDRQGPCRLSSVREGTPAAKAGIQVGDVIKKFDDKRIDDFADLVETVSQYPPETTVKVEIQRGDKTLVIEVTLARKDVYDR